MAETSTLAHLVSWVSNVTTKKHESVWEMVMVMVLTDVVVQYGSFGFGFGFFLGVFGTGRRTLTDHRRFLCLS